MPLDPALLGIIMFVVGMAWYIAITQRATQGHALEAVVIVALVIFGLGMFFVATVQFLMDGGD